MKKFFIKLLKNLIAIPPSEAGVERQSSISLTNIFVEQVHLKLKIIDFWE